MFFLSAQISNCSSSVSVCHYVIIITLCFCVSPLQKESDIKKGTKGDRKKGKLEITYKRQNREEDQPCAKLASLIPLSVHPFVSRPKP